MAYFKCGGAADVYLDGTKVKKELRLKSLYNVDVKMSTLPYPFDHGSAVVYNNEMHLLGGKYFSYSLGDDNKKHYALNVKVYKEVV